MTATYWQAIDRFRAFARAEPDRAAVIYPDGTGPGGLPAYRELTYRELDAWSDAIAERLIVSGVDSGTRTIVLVLPSPELYAILFALLKIGAVPVVIDPGMGVRRMVHCLRAVEAEAFIGIPPAHALRVLFPRSFRRVRTVVTVGKRWFWGGPTLDSWGRTPTGVLLERVPADPADTLVIGFTTGSTGPAKAVALTHGNLAAMVEQVHTARGAVAPDTSLITLPLVGILDLLLGSRCVLPPLIPSKVGSTDPAHVVDAIRRFEVRTMFASPALLIPLLRHLESNPADLSTLGSIFSGGAPVPDWCIAGLRAVLRADAQVFAGYGSTEALPMSTIESRELLDGLVERAHRGDGTCIGRPSDRVRARLVAITDEPIATWADAEALAGNLEQIRGIGELVVSGPNVSTRYYWPDEANRAGKIADGAVIWHRTGDLAWIDDAGRIWFCGRKSQRVRTADGPMFTVQVEQIFNALPGVSRTALVGVGDRGAQRPVLCVELAEGADRGATISGLLSRATQFELTKPIEHFLVHPGFPVDIRHNAKIGREQLAVWAAKQVDAS
ncbi:fatty acid CoA ligase family protein [Nocardia goodfellowii]|uniref:Acyl-CoA synthetase (AMP-forming)/AMP-acid ligase II n=1 Tax=Nocardia goodfellowii TaxID=882446 RepID=A0ABS4QGT5_9NOCA|nr:fatty acid CoA ligase family protein [Nocardia goodfellowii]MBP2190904.1 acyl-CoA synthetase (AMP-forming)/AMP-acid ligase II [Nocardia goodfellowii]